MTSIQSDTFVDRDQSGDYRQKEDAVLEPNILHFKHIYFIDNVDTKITDTGNLKNGWIFAPIIGL